jgi:hypothetical protein
MTTNYFHMTARPLSVGDDIKGNGNDKVDSRIEEELEKRRPANAMSRRDAVYLLQHTDFTTCGVVNPGHIYRAEPTGELQQRDLSWIGEMQKALLKIKYPDTLKKYPDWNDGLIERCCSGYWTGAATASPDWEFLSTGCTVREVLSDKLVDPKKTKGGWKP